MKYNIFDNDFSINDLVNEYDERLKKTHTQQQIDELATKNFSKSIEQIDDDDRFGANDIYELDTEIENEKRVIRLLKKASSIPVGETGGMIRSMVNRLKVEEDTYTSSYDYRLLKAEGIDEKVIREWFEDNDKKSLWWLLLVISIIDYLKGENRSGKFNKFGKIVDNRSIDKKQNELKEFFVRELCLDKFSNNIKKEMLQLFDHVMKYEIVEKKEIKNLDVGREERIAAEEEYEMKRRILDDDFLITMREFKGCDDEVEELFEFYKGNNRMSAYPILEALIKLYEDDPNHTLQDVGIENEKQDWVEMIDYYVENRDVWCEEDVDDEYTFNEEEMVESSEKDVLDSLNNISLMKGRKRGGQVAGKVKGKKNHKKSVVLEKIFTGERFEFDSVDEARKFLEISKPTWLKFKQNSSKLNKTWKLV